MREEPTDYNLGQEIERAWLVRGEYDQVFQARGMASLLFGGVILVSTVLCFLLRALGIEW